MRRSSVRQERCAHTTKNRTEVLCPRVTQAAMIAAASFGLRRSGTFATATSGAAYWAASVRHGPPWPLPVNAPKSIFQNSNPIQARNDAEGLSEGSCNGNVIWHRLADWRRLASLKNEMLCDG